jgi:hypothetical protein
MHSLQDLVNMFQTLDKNGDGEPCVVKVKGSSPSLELMEPRPLPFSTQITAPVHGDLS